MTREILTDKTMSKLKDDAIFVAVEAQCDFDCGIGAGEILGFHKDDNRWIYIDSNGIAFAAKTKQLENAKHFRILEQYSMSSIIYYLFDKYPDSQTVTWEILEDAVRTAFNEAWICTIDDVCNYIIKNLI